MPKITVTTLRGCAIFLAGPLGGKGADPETIPFLEKQHRYCSNTLSGVTDLERSHAELRAAVLLAG
jgi:hypothetical protein